MNNNKFKSTIERFASFASQSLTIEEYIKRSRWKFTYDTNSNGTKTSTRKELVSSSTELVATHQLTEVSKKALKKMRTIPSPFFIYKEGEKLYVCPVPCELTFQTDFMGAHMCALHGCCKRLSPLPDEEGGCAKVRNQATGIENYPWITRGFETCNTGNDVLKVLDCDHFDYEERRTTNLPGSRKKRRDALASFYFDTPEAYNEYLRKKEEEKEATKSTKR